MDSDGSDIEVERPNEMMDALNDAMQFLPPLDDPLDRVEDDWIAGFFDETNEVDEDFILHPDWTTEHFFQRADRPYKGQGGVTAQFAEDATALDFFYSLWTEDVWNRLVQETNRYAGQTATAAAKWKEVTVTQMKAFIGLNFAMGILRLPARSDYWRQQRTLLRTQFGTVMSRDRFDSIWRFLHVMDNTEDDGTDKLYKLRWLIDYLNTRFGMMYRPHGDVTVDESMVRFKGRLAFRQYMPAKPIKWGVKAWALCESKTGFMHKFQVYTGMGDQAGQLEEDVGKGLAHRIVSYLTRPYYHTNIRVYMDNFYTGTQLLNDLLARGILAAGTIRANRKGLPQELLPKNVTLRKHEYRVAQHNDLTFVVWMDTKAVCVLSNFHSPLDTGTVRRRTGNQQQVEVTVPKALADYQKGMKGVDLMDQMVGYYQPNHRSKKWWRRLFFYFMQVSAHNAFVMAKNAHPARAQTAWPCFQDFMEDLIEQLCADHTPARAAPIVGLARPAPRHDVENLYGSKRKVCHVCRVTKPGRRPGATSFGCRQCKVPVHRTCVSEHIAMAQRP